MNRLPSSQRALLQPCIPTLLPSRTSVFARMFLAALDRLAVGHLVLLRPDGQEAIYGDPHQAPGARLTLLDWRACEAVMRAGDIGFAEAYRAGWVDTPDLVALLHLALENESALSGAVHGGWLSRRWYQLRHLFRRNTRNGSRRNIHAHYDLGNPFYALWLDETWSYSAAYFDGRSARSLAEAQEAKYAHICDVLALGPGMHVLEIGCGWGGFALHAARRGVRVHGVTISAAQLAMAQSRVEQAALTDRVKLELRDYRDLDGTYDAIVSIEMFEAVGEAYWPTFFDQISRRLRPEGQAVVQSITIDDARFNAYRHSSDVIREYIFPGGMLPSPEQFARAADRAGFSSCKVLAFGKDYAETLRRWREQFEAHVEEILTLGFDEGFIRMWRLYLCYCEVGFDAGRTDVMQFLLTRKD